MTMDEFLADHAQRPDERWELEDGVPVMMSGGTRRHARVSLNIAATLHAKLRGSGCEPFNSDMLVRTGLVSVRAPDVAIYCDSRDIAGDPDERTMAFPSVVFEVLSPSTQRNDRVNKLVEYQRLPSVHTIVFVESAERLIHVFMREGPRDWHNRTLGEGEALTVVDPAFTLSPDEIFGLAG